MSTEQKTEHNPQIVIKGEKGVASFPVKQFFCAPVAQEKLYKEYWDAPKSKD